MLANVEFLKVWRWEPARCCGAPDVSWTKLADLSTHEGKLLGASLEQLRGVWVVDLAKGAVSLGQGIRTGGAAPRRAPDLGRQREPAPTHVSGRAEEAVAAAQLAAKARVAASEERAREAAAGEAAAAGAAREPRGSGSVTRNHRIGEASRMEMNTGFAAAHGIGADPLADKPKVVYANPPPPKTPLTRALNLAVPETRRRRARMSGTSRVSRGINPIGRQTRVREGRVRRGRGHRGDLPTEPGEPDVVVARGACTTRRSCVDRCRRRRLRCTNRPRRRRRRRPQRVTHV